MRTDLVVLLGLLALAFASMPVYAATAAGRGDPLDVDRGSFVLGNFVRSWFYWFVRPIERLSLAVGASPTAFNLLGVAFGVAAGYCFATGRLNLGGWGVLLGGAADVLDGRIARAQGIAGPRGAFLDSTLDRFAEVGAFVGLAVFFQASTPALVAVATALGGSLLVSYARARGESVGVVCKGGVMQRAERLLLVGFGGILDPSVTSAAGWAPGTLLLGLLALVAVGTVGTAAYRTLWIAQRLD
ncbi:MAG: CDP-alcohol phosphatidyltransferase family protein [Gemmatimonadota bacterium]